MAEKENEYTVPPGNYVFTQDATSGKVKVHVGPITVTLTGNDKPIVFKGKHGFQVVESLPQAVMKSMVIPEGFYGVLTNPVAEGDGAEFPPAGESKHSPDLSVGHRIVNPGPSMFALWPGQMAELVRGHTLKSNQYLRCRVYNAEQAKQHWSAAVVKKSEVTDTTGKEGEGADKSKDAAPKKSLRGEAPADLANGQVFIVKGTEVSFYIPPTGVKVEKGSTGDYEQSALSLEQLEYCILIEENGNKRFPRGPAVIFPKPTEAFVEGKVDGGEMVRNFRAIELNEIQGIHLKATRDHKFQEIEQDLKEGDEFFITGKQVPIYFPREDHAIVKYDGKVKHFSVAVPKGEGRYVMDRKEGIVELVEGPSMLLPNPVDKVIVKRALTDEQSETWYPDNEASLNHNRMLRELAKSTPTTRAGKPSAGEVDRHRRKSTGKALRSRGLSEELTGGEASLEALVSNTSVAYAASAAPAQMDASDVSRSSIYAPGEELTRSSTFTQPRSMVIDTKFEGVPIIKPYTGYAVLVTDAEGQRQVHRGPTTILLEYDEVLEVLHLSTGKPKNTDTLLSTPYLRTQNNQVTDIFEVETLDHVRVHLRLSYLSNFVGNTQEEMLKWFDVTNYVKYFCDHMRSKVKGAIKKQPIQEFYENATEILKNLVLGEEPEGFLFEQNNMIIFDVEVLKVEIQDVAVAKMLIDAQRQTVSQNIQLQQAERRVDFVTQTERLGQEEAKAKDGSRVLQTELLRLRIGDELKVLLVKVNSQLEEAKAKQEAQVETEKVRDIANTSELDRNKAEADQELGIAQLKQALDIELIVGETKATVDKLEAAKAGLSEALVALASQDNLTKVAQAMSVQTMLGGENLVEILRKVFPQGLGLDKLFARVQDKANQGLLNGNGSKDESERPRL